MTEQDREHLARQAGQALGEDAAQTLMESLPPFSWDQVATKDDIARLEARFDRVDQRFDRADERFDALVQRFDGRFNDAEGEMASLHGRLDLLSQELHHTQDVILAAVRGELLSTVATQTRTIMFGMIALFVAMLSAGLAAAGLFL